MRPCICVTGLGKKSCPEEPCDFRAGSSPPLRLVPGHRGGTPPTPAGPALPEAGTTAAARRTLPRRTSPLRAGRCLPRHSPAPGRHHRPQ